jgi:hypothetical protein
VLRQDAGMKDVGGVGSPESGKDVPWGEHHVGHVNIFTAAGFTKVSRPSLRRAVMRIDF